MDSGQAADLAIFILCCLLLLSYALFYFTVDSFRLPLLGRRFVNLYSINVHSRAEWVRLLVRDPKEGINAVQTVRAAGRWRPRSHCCGGAAALHSGSCFGAVFRGGPRRP